LINPNPNPERPKPLNSEYPIIPEKTEIQYQSTSFFYPLEKSDSYIP
jgi:hypothetical protein